MECTETCDAVKQHEFANLGHPRRTYWQASINIFKFTLSQVMQYNVAMLQI